jgi:hypothetical protein
MDPRLALAMALAVFDVGSSGKKRSVHVGEACRIESASPFPCGKNCRWACSLR